MLGGALKKEGATAHGVFTGIDKDVKQTQRELNGLSGKEYKLRVDSSDLKRAQQEVNNLKNEVSRGGFGDVFKGMLAELS